MALKGYTTIELYDAKTGELTDRVEKHNLVTQGVQNYLSCITNMLVKSDQISRNSSHSSGTSGFSKYADDEFLKLFGGVVVCSAPVDESKVYMDYSVLSSIIGHAGLAAAQPFDSMSGGFNTVESSYNTETKTLKLVYDFATDRCNGDIACICLVNEYLGRFGVMYNPTTSGGILYSNYSYNTFKTDNVISFPLLNSDILGGAFIYYSYSNTSYTVTFKVWDFNIEDYLSSFGMLSLQAVVGYSHSGGSLTYVEARDVVLDFSSLKPAWSNYSYFKPLGVDSSSNCCYFYNFNSNDKLLKLRVCTLDMNYNDYTINLTNLYDEYVSLGGKESINTISDFIMRSIDYENNKFFLVDSTLKKLFVGDLNSSTYQVFDIPKHAGSYVVSMNSCIILKLSDMYVLSYERTPSSVYTTKLFRLMNISTYDISNGFYSCMPSFVDYNLGLSQFCRVNNFYVGNSAYMGSSQGTSGVSYDYLATINNQSDILTKTPDKTMKIVYTLREE